jgi:hypothetical protein
MFFVRRSWFAVRPQSPGLTFPNTAPSPPPPFHFRRTQCSPGLQPVPPAPSQTTTNQPPPAQEGHLRDRVLECAWLDTALSPHRHPQPPPPSRRKETTPNHPKSPPLSSRQLLATRRLRSHHRQASAAAKWHRLPAGSPAHPPAARGPKAPTGRPPLQQSGTGFQPVVQRTSQPPRAPKHPKAGIRCSKVAPASSR